MAATDKHKRALCDAPRWACRPSLLSSGRCGTALRKAATQRTTRAYVYSRLHVHLPRPSPRLWHGKTRDTLRSHHRAALAHSQRPFALAVSYPCARVPLPFPAFSISAGVSRALNAHRLGSGLAGRGFGAPPDGSAHSPI